jgi:hypothetical protein
MQLSRSKTEKHTRSDKVRELVVVCLQQWTGTFSLVDDVSISAFHSCAVVHLWQSLSEWRLLISGCVMVCRRQNVVA